MRATADGADKVERVDILVIRQRRALDLDQHIDRHALRRLRRLASCTSRPARVTHRLPQATMPPEHTLMPASRHVVQRIQTLLIAAGGDDVAVDSGEVSRLWLVVVQPASASRPALDSFQRASVMQVSSPSPSRPAPSCCRYGIFALVRVFPRRAHAETRGAGGFRLARRIQHLLHLASGAPLPARFYYRELCGQYLQSFRAGAGLNRQQRTDLHLARGQNGGGCTVCASNNSSSSGLSNRAWLAPLSSKYVGHYGVSKTEKSVVSLDIVDILSTIL
ncbi:Uncharacterised protein [Serratia rubidaea]|uniref:Uncharacterized protein n=1 Tax=Serratia rubidaea TaxID=61652 RepID=A0A4U9HB76_SERRU|nr:Uncharacterised protein [Serratia rubidaea]